MTVCTSRFDVAALRRVPFAPDDIVPLDALPIDAEVKIVGKMLGGAQLAKPTVPQPLPEFVRDQRLKHAERQQRLKHPGSNVIGIGLQGGGTIPFPFTEGVFRALASLKDGDANLLSKVAFISSESGSTPPIVGLAYNGDPLKEFLRLDRVDSMVVPDPAGGTKLIVPQYIHGDPQLVNLPENTIGYSAVKSQEGLLASFEGLAGAMGKGCCQILMGGSHVIASYWRDVVQHNALLAMGVDGTKRTAASKASAEASAAKSQTCSNRLCCRSLKESDFLILREGTPTPLINFSLFAPQQGGTQYGDATYALDGDV